MRHIFHKTWNLNFIGHRKWGYIFSTILLVISLISFVTRGLNYGIDFQGGISIEASKETTIDVAEVREKLKSLKDLTIQSVGTDGNAISIQTLGNTDGNSSQEVQFIKDTLGPEYSFNSIEVIGPRIGKELKEKSILASVLALLAISIYIWVRYEWPFAIGCLVALAHDLIITVGIFSVFGWDFNMLVIAGLLSLAGYDCNDSVVTYDRVRENLHKYKKMPQDTILNNSINETMSRTILTSLTTFFVVLILVVFGGETLRGFSLTLTVGVILGTYSSICIAVPFLRYFNLRPHIKPIAGEFDAAIPYEMEAKKAPLPKGCTGCKKCGG